MNSLAATLDHPTAQKGPPSCWWAPFPCLGLLREILLGWRSVEERVINHKQEM